MEATARTRLVEIMARLGAGDRSAAFSLLEEFGPHIRAAIRRHVVGFGVQPDAETLAELTTSAVLEIAACGGSWRPDGGALPWVWAERRLRLMVSRFVGQHHDSLDAEDRADVVALPVPLVAEDVEEIEVLRGLAAHRPDARLLLEALERVTTGRDRAILLAYELYRAEGDPSPANTVARQFGVSADNARQIVKRSKDRIRVLAGGDAQFAPLGGLALLAS